MFHPMQQWIPAPQTPPEPQPAAAGPGRAPDPLAFTPVPRKHRHDGWTADRQRAFIAALAATGSVKAAARAINMAAEGAYYLRRAPGADSFRAAWEAALASGVQRLTDIAIERAIEGVPIPVFHKGEQVGERRWYNDRLLMFVLKHHQPERYGKPAPLPPGTKHPDTIAREAAAACPACRQRAEEDAKQAEIAAKQAEFNDDKFFEDLVRTYYLKVLSERRARLEGDIVGSDLYLRQLCYFELVLEGCGVRHDLIEMYQSDYGTEPPIYTVGAETGPLTQILDNLRRRAWKEAGERPGPALDVHPNCLWSGLGFNGDAAKERQHARKEAQRRIAEAQAVWEACGTEESWAAFKALGDA
jgi:hypothetical protein